MTKNTIRGNGVGFLQFICPIICLASFFEIRSTSAASANQLSIMQGMTTESATQLSVVTGSREPLNYELHAPGSSPLLISSKEERFESPDQVLNSGLTARKVRFEGLELGINYHLIVRDQAGKILDERDLRTIDLKQAHPRIAIGSCLADKFLKRANAIWHRFDRIRPDIFFLIGDNVYASLLREVTPGKLWNRYFETRMRLPFYFQKNLTPSLAIWDDHDYGKNDGDRTYRYKEESRQVFEAFFAQDAVADVLEKGPGVAQSLRAFGQTFIMLDDRTWRSPKNAYENQTMWGTEQEQWLMAQAARSTNPLWIINGSEYFGVPGTAIESYSEKIPVSFQNFFLPWIRSLSRPFFLVSGDVHYSELVTLPASIAGIDTVEVTSSAMHSYRYIFKLPYKKNRLASTKNDNFIVIQPLESSDNSLHIKTTSYGSGKVIYFEREFTITK